MKTVIFSAAFVATICLAGIAAAVPIVDPILFNAITNTGGDEAPGLGTNFASNSQYQGIDDEEDAFGNNDGLVELSSFIHGEAGGADNGDQTLGNGEVVNFISWDTTSSVTIVGYQITVESDGFAPQGNRATQLIAFYVNNVLQDLFDNNGVTSTTDRIFSGGPITGSSFRVETTQQFNSNGNRILEINAIVPEPSSLSLLSVGLAALALVRKRK